MRRWINALGAAMALGCGAGGGLADPAEGPDGGAPVGLNSLWPLAEGNQWAYQISDPLLGRFEKTVRVVGEGQVPGGNQQAWQVTSAEPHRVEVSYQVEQDGLVCRVREDDYKGGALARSMSWAPAMLKALSAGREVGWRVSATAHEVERYPDGTLKGEKERTDEWEVLAVDEEVTVPAGVFKTLKVRRIRPDKPGYERTYWLAPGVGKVREEGERTEELTRFQVKER